MSPSNKRAGVDRRAYLRKQREVLESDASLVEIDLLRAGERLLPNAELEAYLVGLAPQPAYLVMVNRAWCRLGVEMAYQLFAVSLREVLPCIAIPLREGEDEVDDGVGTRAHDGDEARHRGDGEARSPQGEEDAHPP